MNLEEIVRIHGKIHKFMGQHIINLVSSLFTPQEILEKTEKLNLVDPILDVLTSIDVLPEFKLENEITKNAYLKLRSFSIYMSEDLGELLKLDYTSIAAKVMQKQFKKYLNTRIEPSEEETQKQIDDAIGDKTTSFNLLKSLGVPVISRNFNHKEIVETTIKNAFAPLYNSLNEKTKQELEQIKKERFDKIYSDIKSFSGAAYAWALLTDEDKLKNVLALSALKGMLSTTPNHASHSFEILYDETIKAQKESRRLQKLSDKLQNENASTEKNINELRQRAQNYEGRIRELESQPPKEIVVEKQVPVHTDDSKALDGLIHELSQVKRNYEEKTSKIGKELAAAKSEIEHLKEQLETSASVGELNNGTNYSIFVTPELKDRYVKTLHKYYDNTMNGNVFSEVIDSHLITYLFQRIKSVGLTEALKECAYAKNPHFNIVKHDNPPAKKTRMFFRIKENSVIIADIFTPDEHQGIFQNGTGRYYDAEYGKISYTTEESKLIQIKKTIRELFEK